MRVKEVNLMEKHESACILIPSYAWLWMFMLCFWMYVPILWSYVALCYVYEIKIKRNPLQELMFSNPLKMESMHAHYFHN